MASALLPLSHRFRAFAHTLTEMLTLDLKKSNDNLVVHGKLIIYLSTNVSQPINNPANNVEETGQRLGNLRK